MTNSLHGKIIKGVGGFYYVDTKDGVIECRARGRFRHEGVTPLVGDFVVIKDAYIIDVLPRKNSLIRPKVANVDKAVITFSATKPKINLEILDRFLILTAAASVEALICINKTDLVKDSALSSLREIYANCGSDIVEASALKKIGIDEISERLTGVTSVFAGPSGVGKSSIINIIAPNSNFKTAEVSKKISRGKHTTREAVLVSLENGGYIVDTPGFTSLSLAHIESNNLCLYFNEFAPYINDCKFPSCSHTLERTDDCAVKKQVGININKKRYDSFIRIYNELIELEVLKYD